MNNTEPTLKQLKEFWEWCGQDVTHKYIQTADTVCKKCRKTLDYNKGYNPLCKAPDLTLDNLFKCAVSKLDYCAIQFVSESSPTSRAEVRYNKTSSQITSKKPELALFWAIWKVIKEERI